MQTNNHKIVDYDLVLDAKFGKEGTPERIQSVFRQKKQLILSILVKYSRMLEKKLK